MDRENSSTNNNSDRIRELISRLDAEHRLTVSEYEEVLKNRTEEDEKFAQELALKWRKKIYGNGVYIRGLIEFTNYCKNNCHYCGIQSSNREVERYRLTKEDILSCCEEGYKLGFRTFVLQGGEDPYFTDERMVDIIKSMRENYPDCAITISIGERTKESYKAFFDAGANRYLLRHETADREHYNILHPKELSFDKRRECLGYLKDIGFQVGCGFMVGSPGQTYHTLAEDLYFIQEFQPEMCGIGPFIPQHSTIFADKKQGKLSETLFLLSLLRLIKPNLLIPSTTALGTIHQNGREMGIEAGANVVMPNLSPVSVRKKYSLYDNKICTGDEAAQSVKSLNQRMSSIGYELLSHRGDIKK